MGKHGHRGPDVSVPLDALRKDAGVWNAGAETLQGLTAALNEVSLGIKELSFVAEDAGLLATYRNVQTRLSGFCSQGATVFSDIGGKLISAADNFQVEDDRCRRDIRKHHHHR